MQLSEYVHTPGAHCGSASLRNLSNYYDWGFHESLCFGLDAGLGFGYYERGPTSRLIIGRNGQLETGFFETRGSPIVRRLPQTRRDGPETRNQGS
jgi:hypothetical protein